MTWDLNELVQRLNQESSPSTRLKLMANRLGQYSTLTAFDPQNRGSHFIKTVLADVGIHVEIEDEGEPVLAPSCADRSPAEHDGTTESPNHPSKPE